MSVTLNSKRVSLVMEGQPGPGPVIYWMSRDQRVQDNWALLWAQKQALDRQVPLVVVFCLVSDFLGATIRQFGFMLKGLSETAETLAKHHISFFLLQGEPGHILPGFIRKHQSAMLVTDFDPLRIKRKWKEDVKSKISCPFYQVDAHNIVPCWTASPKQEWAAYTFRPKIHKVLDEYLEPFPSVMKHPFKFPDDFPIFNRDALIKTLKVDRSIPELDWIEPGEEAARDRLQIFLESGLAQYDKNRNDPNKQGQSGLSPYLHFGQIAPQRVALDVQEAILPDAQKEAFLEELIVRRELSDNFCYYNPDYDSITAFPNWAKETLKEHESDPRSEIYSKAQLEAAETHDPLWNAAQLEMMHRGKMHGYMRMYWAKKILEWTSNPDTAMKIAIVLNDKYELDGRDSNGYTGIAWSIGGVHDRAWGARPIFGKIRYMSLNGAKSKFDVNAYIQKMGTI